MHIDIATIRKGRRMQEKRLRSGELKKPIPLSQNEELQKILKVMEKLPPHLQPIVI